MSLLKRANEQEQTEWRPVPEGLWRWTVGKPELKLSEKFGNYQVRFPLTLTESERDRLSSEHPATEDGIQQSWRASYATGLSLGYVQRDGQYKSTKLIDFLSACLGSENSRKFREWIGQGGGPPKPSDPDNQQMELDEITDWLNWWDNLEVYGTIRHEEDKQQAGEMWARFAGPMAVGSLPGQRDPEYQAHGRGKLRAIIAESQADKPAVQFTQDGAEIKQSDKMKAEVATTRREILEGDPEKELPF